MGIIEEVGVSFAHLTFIFMLKSTQDVYLGELDPPIS